MTENNLAPESSNTPSWFWAVAGIGLVWNLLGVMAYVFHSMMTPEMIAQLSPAEQELYKSYPAWMDYTYAAAVFGGALGCVALLLRNAFALPLFVISLVGVLIQHYHTFFMSNAFEVYGNQAVVMPLVVITVAVGLVWFSYDMKNKGVLK
ncbi:MAG: hypothetical protein OQJ89_00300 [Kangiellaceae bacterium]|nr:hypothetical protein [Kangiellaceae bacterium]MCW8998873.1 hypothetical protein [Kangiellaceae bacterium]MCW9015379.1 hypothetical protein [Kangiellaceae bacterium]